MRTTLGSWKIAVALAVMAVLAPHDHARAAAPVLGGALPGSPPGPLFPVDNWWNVDISSAPVDASSASYIGYVNNCASCCPAGRRLHPDFGGDVAPSSVQTYGVPYAVVDGSQPKRSVIFYYSKESDGVDHTTNTSYPFYPLPDEAITQPHWVEGGDPASVDLRSQQDRHLIVVDRDNRFLYELWNVWYDSTNAQWYAGSGAFFDMNTNDRRPDTWTSADAAGLAMLPGLVRYDEVNFADPTGTYEIPHAFRVTVRATNGDVYPASHNAGNTGGALPMGARLRLKASTDISGFTPDVQRIFKAMKKHGLIVADNGSDMYITGTYDPRWNNDVLNPAFSQLTACNFEVVQLGWIPPARNQNRLLGDFDGGGHADFLWRNTASGAVAMWLTNGGTTVSAADLGAVATSWAIVGVGDFDGDGRADILWRDASGNVALWLMHGGAITSTVGLGNVGGAWSPLVGDFDGDGKADILWRHTTSGAVVMWLMNGRGLTSNIDLGTVPPTWTILGIGDFDGDRRADILWRDGSGNLALWLMNGGTVQSASSPGNVPTTWGASIADFDGNGTADILWRQGASGSVVMWLMNGAHIAGTTDLGTVPPAWKVIGLGDVDGDGRADILWQDAAGNLALWSMNGPAVIGTRGLGLVPDPWIAQ